MKVAFKPGTLVRYAVLDSTLAEIVSYANEGFYQLRHIPESTCMMAHEDDIMLDTEYKAWCERRKERASNARVTE